MNLLRALLLAACGLLSVLALAACGSTGNAASSTNPEDARLKFAQCMRDHGVNLPDPGQGRRLERFNFNPAKFRAARQACQKYAAAAFPKLTPQQRAELQDRLVKFSQCMRQHGVNLPDPTTNGPGEGFFIRRRVGPGGPNPRSPAFQAAQKACQSLLPQRRGGGPGLGFRGGGPAVQAGP
jgi:hypothetical protein